MTEHRDFTHREVAWLSDYMEPVRHRRAARHYARLRRENDRTGRVMLHPPYSATEKLWMIGTLIFVALFFAYFGWQMVGRPGL